MENKVSEAKAKDMIIEYCVQQTNTSIEASIIAKEVFHEGISTQQVIHLVERIVEHNHKLLDISLGEYDGFIRGNFLTKTFQEQGGFQAIEQQKFDIEAKNKFKEQLELDLAKSNIEANILNKKNSRSNKVFSIINIIIAIINLVVLLYQLKLFN